MAKNNLRWLESEARDLSSEASKGQILLLGRLPLECSSLSALSTCTVESPQVSSVYALFSLKREDRSVIVEILY